MADQKRALIVGANRGIGLGVVREFLAADWAVIATARKPAAAMELQALAAKHPGRLTVAKLEITDPADQDGFATAALAGRTLDIALINAGVSGPAHRSADQATAAEIGDLMNTNAIAPIRLARILASHMRADTGVVAFTSSVMGSVALNAGGHELYRASKAALNSLSRGLYSELSGRNVTLLSLHPGWVRTDMGGPNAAVSVEDSARGMVEVMLAEQGTHHHAFVDYLGKEMAW
jgi:NAD(P)-dependent dehydrogenase (short-subunit alcohol dehydrogenase family)